MDNTVQVVINGTSRFVAESVTLAAVLADLGLESARVIVEHNGSIVSSEELDRTRISSGDRLELVRFMGGG